MPMICEKYVLLHQVIMIEQQSVSALILKFCGVMRLLWCKSKETYPIIIDGVFLFLDRKLKQMWTLIRHYVQQNADHSRSVDSPSIFFLNLQLERLIQHFKSVMSNNVDNAHPVELYTSSKTYWIRLSYTLLENSESANNGTSDMMSGKMFSNESCASLTTPGGDLLWDRYCAESRRSDVQGAYMTMRLSHKIPWID